MGELEALKVCSDPQTMDGLRMLLMVGIGVSLGALMLDGWRFKLPPLPPTGRPGLWCDKHRCPIGQCANQHQEFTHEEPEEEKKDEE